MKHGSHTVPDEWRRRDTHEYRTVRCKGRVYGELRRYPGGKNIFLAKRRPDDVFYKTDSWTFDVETIDLCKILGVRFVGVLTTTGDRYLTYLDTVSKTGGATLAHGEKHMGRVASRWYVPRNLFRAIRSVEGELEAMKLPKRA